jgi:hypothetical protein
LLCSQEPIRSVWREGRRIGQRRSQNDRVPLLGGPDYSLMLWTPLGSSSSFLEESECTRVSSKAPVGQHNTLSRRQGEQPPVSEVGTDGDAWDESMWSAGKMMP